MIRRSFLKRLAVLPLAAAAVPSTAGAAGAKLKIMIKVPGPRRPNESGISISSRRPLSEAGHEVQIFLLGEAVSLMRKSVANAVVPVGWPPLSEALSKIAAKKIPIYACGACSRARGVTEADLNEYGASLATRKFLSRSSNGQIKS